MSKDLVVFGEDWGRHPSSTQHLVANLPGQRRVLWVNSIGMRRPRLTMADLRRSAEKISQIAGNNRTRDATSADVPDGMSVVSPLVLPWPGSRVACRMNRVLMRRQLRRAMRRCGIRRPVLWTSLPTALLAVGSLDEQKIVYYCGDDFSTLAGVDHGPIREMERELVERADMVLVASEVLAERFPRDKTIYIPQGVDLDVFSAPASRAPDLPKGRRIAGFVGGLAEWVDMNLLRQAALDLPEWLFVFVGKTECDIAAIASLPNVRILGPRPYRDLGAYVQHWDVSLIPFTDTPVIRAANPLKLREYLAAGTPIATTDFPALDPYRDLLSVLKAGGSFAEVIRAAAADTSRNDLRRESVTDATWRRRSEQVHEALELL